MKDEAIKLNHLERQELSALMEVNDVLGRPTAIHKLNLLADDVSYQRLIDLGLVKRYARAPKGWGNKDFFGAKITKAGRAALAFFDALDATTHPEAQP